MLGEATAHGREEIWLRVMQRFVLSEYVSPSEIMPPRRVCSDSAISHFVIG